MQNKKLSSFIKIGATALAIGASGFVIHHSAEVEQVRAQEFEAHQGHNIERAMTNMHSIRAKAYSQAPVMDGAGEYERDEQGNIVRDNHGKAYRIAGSMG